MSAAARRLAREKRTLEAMIAIYCRDVHAAGRPLCAACEELRSYAEKRLARCPYQVDKPTCVNCPIHCYMPTMRARIKEVMRYAGPRLIFRHPILALMHLMDGHRSPLREPSSAE